MKLNVIFIFFVASISAEGISPTLKDPIQQHKQECSSEQISNHNYFFRDIFMAIF